jgi:hypothetical protein
MTLIFNRQADASRMPRLDAKPLFHYASAPRSFERMTFISFISIGFVKKISMPLANACSWADVSHKPVTATIVARVLPLVL